MPQNNDYWEGMPAVFSAPTPSSGSSNSGPSNPSASSTTSSSDGTIPPSSISPVPSTASQNASVPSPAPSPSPSGATGSVSPSASGFSSTPPVPPINSQSGFNGVNNASAMPVAAAPAPKKSHGWIVAIVVVLSVLIFSLVALRSCADIFSGFSGSSVEAASITQDSIAIIDIDGTIAYDGSANSPEGLYSLLEEAEENDFIKAVVLRVNSGGGTATAGEEMAIHVKDFEKPIVVSSASINASAAYEISSQADYIYVAKTTEIGSIGTAMQITDLSGLLSMLGIDVDVITSSDSKDSSYGYRPLTESEREYYQRMIDQINQTFIETVAEGRSMDIEQVRTLATGLSYTGIDAVANGLADAIGTREDAIAKAAELAGISRYKTCELTVSGYDLSSLEGLLGSQNAQDKTALDVLKQRYGFTAPVSE